jgi:hypothetical protein
LAKFLNRASSTAHLKRKPSCLRYDLLIDLGRTPGLMRKEALAEFAHYLQFVDILMTATGVTAFIIMAGICVPHGRPTNQNPKYSISSPAPLSW